MVGVQCRGLWVPETETRRFEEYREFEGLPDLDVSKVAKCIAQCETFGTALDIGAHVGAVAVYLARHFRKVIAFEAVPSTFELLQRNVEDLQNVESRNIAIGEGEGEVFFSHLSTHGQLSHVEGSSDLPRSVRVGPIPVRTIDSLGLTDVSFIKIDVEGYELPVVAGARETLERCRPLVLVEQGGNEEKHYGRPRDEASAFLEKLGMTRHPQEPRMSKDRLYSF